jgi:hypothetical protein
MTTHGSLQTGNHLTRMFRATPGGRATARRETTPLHTAPPRARGERMLASEHTAAADPIPRSILASSHGLYHAESPRPGPVWQRLGWEDIVGVGWDRTTGLLHLTGLMPGLRMHLPGRTRLVELIRDRVTATKLASARVRLADGTAAWLCARRRPGTDDVSWIVVLEGGSETDDPEVQGRICAAIHEIRVQAGI